MAIFRVQGPDGATYRIEGPDDATPAQIESFAAQQFAAKPKAPAAQAEDPGVLASMGIGFGRMSDRLYQGVKQASMTLAANNPFNPLREGANAALKDQAQTQQFRDEGYKPLQEQHPVATAVGESAPLLAMPMGASLKAASGLSALPGLLEYGSGNERLSRGAMGAAGGGIGFGIGKGIGSVLSPGMEASSSEAGRLADVMKKNGIPLDAAQVTGNQVLLNTKAALSRIPWTAGGQQASDAAKQEAFNSAILKYIGSSGKAATPDVMADAHAAIIGKMNDAAGSVALTMDDKAVDGLSKVANTYLRRLPTDQKPVIGSYIDDLTELIGKNQGIPGDVYNKTRSELGQIAFNTNNITVREGAKGLQRVLDDAFDRQAPADAVKAMKEARAEYAKYMTTTSAMQKARTTNGDIPAKQIYAQAQHDIPGFERGAGGDFNDLVRAGRQFLPDPIANSGTPERLLYQNLLTMGTMGGMGAAGGALAGTDPISGAAMGLAGFGVSKGAQKALNSQLLSRYLTSQLLEEETKRLMGKAGATAGLLGMTAVTP